MTQGDFVFYIDHQGRQHKAQAVAVREIPDGEPIISASYVNPATRKPEVVHELMHIDHPAKQETNPEMPTIHLHAWKHLDEDHVEPAEDHPVFDHPHIRPKTDDTGNIIPKARPQWEAQIAAHRATVPVVAVPEIPEIKEDQQAAAAANALIKVIEEQQPNPGSHEAHAFDFDCQVCGRPVKRMASHLGGKQFEPDARDGKWEEHACSAADIKAHREKLTEAAKPKNPASTAQPEPSPSEMLAKGWKPPVPETAQVEQKPAEVSQPEIDVIEELEKAPPAPTEDQPQPPTDDAA